jgi:hypothetical protein
MARDLSDGPPNNGMHPTRARMNPIVRLRGFAVVCGRVMPGVMPLRRADRQRGCLFEARAVMLKSSDARKLVLCVLNVMMT